MFQVKNGYKKKELMYNTGADEAISIVLNIRSVLPKVSTHEHLSGLFQAIVAACCNTDMSIVSIAKCLDIDWKTARNAKLK